MARAVGNRVGAFDSGGAVADVIDTDAQQGPINLLTGAADNIPAPNGQSVNYNGVRGGNFLIGTAGVDAIVLAAPIAGVDDNVTLQFQDVGGHAHTITCTGKLVTYSASVNQINFTGAFAGAIVYLRAYQGKWYVGSTFGGITFS